MKIAVVILNWNGVSLLKQFLPNVIENSKEHATVYLADNNSTDNSIAYVKNHYPSVKIIKNKTNGGYAKGYNDALQSIEADIYCLLNSDIEVTKNWLAPIINEYKNNALTAIIQPKILDYKNKNKFEYAGAAGGFLDAFGYPYCRGRIFDTLEEDTNQYNNDTIFWASGACFFIKSSVFKELQGFDEDFFAHQEEIDLCWRANNKGYLSKYVNSSVVYHVGGATLNTQNPKKTYLNYRNNLLTILKNIPTEKLFLVIFTRLILDGLAGIKFLIEFKPKHTFAILKAHLAFYGKIRKFTKKRQVKSFNTPYFKHKSIVWQYFIEGKKTFSELQ